MVEREIGVPTRDGVMPTFVAHPHAKGAFPVIVVYMDIQGIREELRAMTRRFAAAGYYAMLPDLYYRLGVRFDHSFSGMIPSRGTQHPDWPADLLNRFWDAVAQTTDELVLSDTEAILAYVEAEDAASTGPKGCVGYCRGGRNVLRALAAYPDQFVAGLCAHGTRLVTDAPDSAHRDLRNIRGEIYFDFGEEDPMTPPPLVAAIRAEAERYRVRADIEVFPGAGHAFVFQERPDLYVERAAERHWARALELFGRTLPHSRSGASSPVTPAR